MAKINELVEQVVRKETLSFQEKLEIKRAEAKQALLESQTSISANLLAEKTKIDQVLKTRYQIAQHSQKIAHRDQLLREKQVILTKLFDLAEARLANLSAEEFQNFMTSCLAEFKGQGELLVKLGEKSQTLIDQEWLKSIDIEGVSLQLSEDNVAAKAGFMIEKAGSQYNFLTETLIQAAKAKLTVEVSKLFQQ